MSAGHRRWRNLMAQVVFHPEILNQTLSNPQAARQAFQPLERAYLARVVPATPGRNGQLAKDNYTEIVAAPGRIIPFALRCGNRASYAKAVHEPTKPHVIRPRTKQSLYFKGKAGAYGQKGTDKFFNQVNHPGTKGQPWMKNTLVGLLGADRVYKNIN